MTACVGRLTASRGGDAGVVERAEGLGGDAAGHQTLQVDAVVLVAHGVQLVAFLADGAEAPAWLETCAISAFVPGCAAGVLFVASIGGCAVALIWGAKRFDTFISDTVINLTVRRVDKAEVGGAAIAGAFLVGQAVATVVVLLAARQDGHAPVGGCAVDLALEASRLQADFIYAVPEFLRADGREGGARVGRGAPEGLGLEGQALAAVVVLLAARRNFDAELGGRAQGLGGSADGNVETNLLDAVVVDAVGRLCVALAEGRAPSLVDLVGQALTAFVGDFAAILHQDALLGGRTELLV